MASIIKRALLVALLVLPAMTGEGVSEAQESSVPPVVIDYFYEPGCADCFRVRDQVEPKLKERFASFYVMNRWDAGIKTNVVRLVTYQETLGIKDNKPVCMVVDYHYVLNGFDAIKTGLLERVDECLSVRGEPDWRAPEPIPVTQLDGAGLADDRLRQFTLPAVITAGLIDGINPCAISTLVFFMGLLAVAKIRGPGLLMMGTSFCLASFITYTAIGFGLLRALHLFTGFPMLRFTVEMLMTGLLGIFAYLSFRDAYRFGKTGNSNDVTLQLSHGIKMRIHAVMRRGLGTGSLILGGLIIGGLVTMLESVCTGQVYVPTLVLVIKAGGPASQAWSYLLLYNAMFIVPLVGVFLLTFLGLHTETLLEWSKRNVVPSKILLGIFFLAMAVLVALL